MLASDGYELPTRIITCGSPAPGIHSLDQMLDKKAIDQLDLRNLNDPVWDTPTWPFTHRLPPVEIEHAGDGTGLWKRFSYHRIANYQAGAPADVKPVIDLIAALYNPQPGDFDQIEETHGVVWGIRRNGPLGRPAVVFRGSMTDEDWTRDFIAIPIIVPNFLDLGLVHAGFVIGMHQATDAIVNALSLVGA